MASIDDVNRETNMLLDALVRTPPDGLTGGMGQVGSFPGLAPQTYRAALKARDASAEILKVVQETEALLGAVNVETLGRVEARISDQEQTLGRLESETSSGRASTDQAFGRLESAMQQVLQFLPTVREDMTALTIKLDGMAAGHQQDMSDLSSRLDALKSDIQALPH